MRKPNVAFDALFWIVAVPVLFEGLSSAWSKKSPLLRNAALISACVIVLWHIGLLTQTYVNPSWEIVPETLTFSQELISIAMGIIIALFGLSPPRKRGLGLIGLLIIIGHSRKLLGAECYYTC